MAQLNYGMRVSEKPSGCDIEQAGVAEIDGRGEGSRVKFRLLWILWIGIFAICVVCFVSMYLWIRRLEDIVMVNAQNSQKLSEMQSFYNIHTKHNEDDEDDDDDEYPISDNVVVRALRDGTLKVKKRKNKKRRGRGKKRCPCKRTEKRDVQSSNQRHNLTYLKGIASSTTTVNPYNNQGQFLWQKPDWNLGNYYQYGMESQELIKTIKISITGAYEFRAQVVLGGPLNTDFSNPLEHQECGIKLIKTRAGVETELSRSVITQAKLNNGNVLDVVQVGGIFYIIAGEEVFVRRSCNHAKFIVYEDLSSFSAVFWTQI